MCIDPDVGVSEQDLFESMPVVSYLGSSGEQILFWPSAVMFEIQGIYCHGLFGNDIVDFFMLGGIFHHQKSILHDATNEFIGFADAECSVQAT